MSCPSNNLNQFPNETLKTIFRHLDSSSLYVAGQVCKRWSDIVQIVHDESWRSLTKAVMLKAEIIGPNYKSRGWVEQDHSWKTCNCINIGRELVLYKDIELLVHDMEIIEDASWNSSIEDASWNSRQDSLETMEIRTLEQAKAAIRFAAAGILTTIDFLHFNPFLCENDDIASLENIDLLVKITKNELLNLSKNFINHFSHIHCTLLEVKFYEEILTDVEIKSLTEVLNDGVEQIEFKLACCIHFPYIENYDGRGKCSMIDFQYEVEHDEEYESDVQKMQEWANSKGWTVEVFNQPDYEYHLICLARIDQ